MAATPPPASIPASAADLYPPGPAEVPADLLVPTPAYQRHAYLAIACVLGFLAAYLAFTGWLVWMTIHGFALAFGGPKLHFGLLIVSACAGLLAAFLLKSLFFIKRAPQIDALEITAADEPQLFAFLHQLADEAKAPRPHRVFISHDVNAAVFYDISLLNFIFPSKKNLALGLGLVNALTLSELKAVLAHELGHFAQRTMAIGRWVYIAMQITGQLVNRRDGFDNALVQLTRFDLRVAWIGWLMQLVVWATRSLMETASLGVVVAHRALGREMERQADLVAVSLTGSDALVHALYKLSAADQALGYALQHMEKEAKEGRAVSDVLALQSRTLERMRDVLCDPMHGQVPPLPGDGAAASHRVFTAQLAYPPKMWETHPPSDERERNAKRRYLPAALDERSAWVLFRDAEALRAKVTANRYIEGKRPKETAPLEETLATLDASLAEPFYDPSYRGAYLGRSPVREAALAQHLYGEEPAQGELPAELAALYPESLRATIVRRDELLDERAMLRAIEHGVLKASTGKRLLYRGKEHARRELPGLLAQTEKELDEVEAQLAAHDRRCRTAHLAAARALGAEWAGWEAHLRGTLALLHYADHRERDLDDAIGVLDNVISVALADGKVSDRERQRVLAAAHETYGALALVHEQAKEVELGPELARRLDKGSWAEVLGELELPEPALEHLGDWLAAIHSWAGSASHELMRLRRAALATLLEAERTVAAAAHAAPPGEPQPAPAPPPAAPARYRAFSSKDVRPRQTKLGWWDRFATADGWLPATLRFTAAGAIVGAAVWLGVTLNHDAEERAGAVAWGGGPDRPVSGRSRLHLGTVTVYNGLERPVVVQVGERRAALAAHQGARLAVRPELAVELFAQTVDGERIEGFVQQIEPGQGYLYNVANAAPVELWKRQGALGRPEQLDRRWMPLDARALLGPPPPAGERSPNGMPFGIAAPARLDAELARALVPRTPQGQAQLVAMAESHARWDGLDAAGLLGWLRLLRALDAARADEVLAELRGKAPDDLSLRLVELEAARGPRLAQLCAEAEGGAQRDPDAALLAALCKAPAQRAAALLAAAATWPDHPWLAARAGQVLAARRQWAAAQAMLEKARHRLPGAGLELALARLRRASTPAGEAADLSDLVDDEPHLSWLLVRPDAEGMTGDRQRFHASLGRGDWEVAELQANQTGDRELWWMLAASEGPARAAAEALPALAAREVERLAATRELGAAAALYGLAVRLGKRDAEALRERVRQEAPALDAFLGELARGEARPGSPGDKALLTADLLAQAAGYLAAAVALGDACPAGWRRLAKQLLLPAERPALR